MPYRIIIMRMHKIITCIIVSDDACIATTLGGK
jgi:hypothetical protein